jgi:peptidyl-prolyl cis-trans isomerase SurA
MKTQREFATRCILSFAIAMIVVGVTTAAAFAQNVVIVVNGDPITALDVEQRTKFIKITTQKTPSRQEVLNELIDERLKIKEGRRWGLELPDSEVDSAYANMGERMHKTADQLTQDLEKSGIHPNTLKERIKAQMVWENLVRGRFSASLQLSDKDIDLAVQTDKEPADAPIDFLIRPILLLVAPGSPSAVYESRRKDAEALRSRFKSCEEGLPAARAMEGTVIRAQVVRSSADMQPELRKILDAIPVGQLSAPEVTKLGIELFAICGKQDSKSEGRQKKRARDAIYSKRFEETSRKYLERLRREALIERK